MIPHAWSYLAKNYFKLFLLCLLSIVATMLVTRLQEIARFAAISPNFFAVVKFTLFQLPYLLPLALPISSLFATLSLVRRLSLSQELTALRASGMKLSSIAYPLLISASFICFCDFLLGSEITPRCRLATRHLVTEITEINPLFSLQRRGLIKIRNLFVSTGEVNQGEGAHDVILIAKDRNQESLTITLAKQLILNEDDLIGKQVTMISPIKNEVQDFDALLIEDFEQIKMPKETAGQLLGKESWLIDDDYRSLRELLSIAKHDVKGFWASKTGAEVTRRLSITLAPLTFALLGIAFGICHHRSQNRRQVVKIALLAMFYLICYSGAKSMPLRTDLALMIYFTPHLAITLCSIRAFNRVAKGQY